MLESDPHSPPPTPVKSAPVKRTADARLATLAPKRYELESARLSCLTALVIAFVPAPTDDAGFGPRADDATSDLILISRDAALLAAFAAIVRISGDS